MPLYIVHPEPKRGRADNFRVGTERNDRKHHWDTHRGEDRYTGPREHVLISAHEAPDTDGLLDVEGPALFVDQFGSRVDGDLFVELPESSGHDQPALLSDEEYARLTAGTGRRSRKAKGD